MKIINNLLLICFLTISTSIYSSENFDKWIVVTTIQSPTPQLKKMAKMAEWHMVVVGDKKTPKDWSLENCDYLSPDDQMKLGYELTALLPWNHYSRKNIGYLYAIEHGATLIYETDDDNEPISNLDPLPEESVLSSVISDANCVNIYSYFGIPDIWPRGFPLEIIGKKTGNVIILPPSSCLVGIEQGIVNQEPDLDAIYRLARDDSLFFKKMLACYLPTGTYCPFNSQNTFFHKSLFASLYIPSSVSMRVSDIWRGYIAEKLLEKTGRVIAFSGPNAIQLRNPHNYFEDFLLEKDLYFKSGKLVSFLQNWKIDDLQDPMDVMPKLYKSLIDENFIEARETPLLKAWINDLKKVGFNSY